MPTSVEKANELKSRHLSRIENIRRNSSLSSEGKRRAIAREYLDTRQTMQQLEEEQNGGRNKRMADLERKYFALPIGAPGADVLSYRDALDRARAIKTQDEAAATASMAQALRVADTILAKALLTAAYDNGWVETINAWGEANTTAQPELQELWDLRQGSLNGNTLENDWAFALLAPTEVAALGYSALNAAAASAGRGDTAERTDFPEYEVTR